MNDTSLRVVYWLSVALSVIACVLLLIVSVHVVQDRWNFFHYTGFGRMAVLFLAIVAVLLSVLIAVAIAKIVETFRIEKAALTSRMRELEDRVGELEKGNA